MFYMENSVFYLLVICGFYANASATAIEWNTSNFKRETLAVDPPIPLRRTELYRGQNASIPDGSNFNKNSLKSRLVGVGEAGSICELDLGNFAVVHFEDKMSREIMDICNGNEPSGPLDSFSATFVTHSITLTASEVAYVNKKYVGAKRFDADETKLFLQGPFTFISPTAYLAMAGVTARRSSSVDVMTNYGRILPLSFALDEMEPITRGELDLLKTHNGNILEISTIRALRIHVQQIDTALTSPKSPAANSRKDSNAEEDHVCIPISTVLDDIPAEFSKDHLRNLTMAHLNKVIYSKSAHIYNAFRRSINCGRVDTAVRSESSGKVGLEDIELNLCFCWRKGQDDQCAQATYKIRFVDFDIQRILRRTFPGASDCAFRNVFIDDIEQIPRVLQPVPYGLEAGEIRHVRFVPPRIDQETGAAITTSLDGAPTQTAYLEQTPKPIPHPPQPIAPLTIDSQTFTPKVILGQTPAVELGTNVIVKQGPATSIGGQMVAFNNNDLVVGSKTIPLPSSLFEQESSAALVWNGHQVTIISQPGNREQTLVVGGSTIIISDGQYTSAGHTMTIGDGKITVDGSLTYSFKPLTSNVPTIVKSPTPDGKTIAADGSSGKQSSAPRKYWQGLKFQLGIFTALLFILP